MSPRDLWPDDIQVIPEGDTPISLLREQAKNLGKRTKNIVTAEVDIKVDANFEVEELSADFMLNAPAINYSFRLFTVRYDITELPAYFVLDSKLATEVSGKFNPITSEISTSNRRMVRDILTPPNIKAETLEQFINILEILLTSERTRKIVAALLGQSQDNLPGSRRLPL